MSPIRPSNSNGPVGDDASSYWPGGKVPEDKRSRIIAEILSTEMSYVNSLDVLLKVFINPLKEAASQEKKEDRILTDEKIKILFQDVDQISAVNHLLMEDIKKRIQAWHDKQLIGDLFKKFAPFFKLYTGYVAGQQAACTLLTKLEKQNKKYKKFVTSEAVVSESKGMSVASLLIMPVQRVPRYRMLIEEVFKKTTPDHPDYKDLEECLNKIKDAANHINQNMHVEDSNSAVRELQAKFNDGTEILAPGRTIVHQGILYKKCRSKDKIYTFFLFNDTWAYASKTTLGQYEMRKMVSIADNFHVDESEGESTFCIRSSLTSYLVYPKDPADKAVWLNKLTEVMSKFGDTLTAQQIGADTTFVAPVWQQDHSVTECMVSSCKAKFSAFKRKHHCRRCGRVVCDKCSKQKMALNTSDKIADKDKQQRVCDPCFEEHMRSLGGDLSATPTLTRQGSKLGLGLNLGVGGDESSAGLYVSPRSPSNRTDSSRNDRDSGKGRDPASLREAGLTALSRAATYYPDAPKFGTSPATTPRGSASAPPVFGSSVSSVSAPVFGSAPSAMGAPAFGFPSSPLSPTTLTLPTVPTPTFIPTPTPIFGAPVVKSDWTAYRDAQGIVYYHNARTQESIWTPPPGENVPLPPP